MPGDRLYRDPLGSRDDLVSMAMSLADVRLHIDRNYARPLTVDRLARAGRSVDLPLHPRFRAHAGQTPHQYLRTCRIERARELLVTTPLPVTDICDAVGFQSLGSFSSLFRKLTGETPAAYRAARRRSAADPDVFRADVPGGSVSAISEKRTTVRTPKIAARGSRLAAGSW